MPQTEGAARGGIAVSRIMAKTTLLSERGNQEALSQSAPNPLLVLFVTIAKFYNLPQIAISVVERFLKSVHGKSIVQYFLITKFTRWKSRQYGIGSN